MNWKRSCKYIENLNISVTISLTLKGSERSWEAYWLWRSFNVRFFNLIFWKWRALCLKQIKRFKLLPLNWYFFCGEWKWSFLITVHYESKSTSCICCPCESSRHPVIVKQNKNKKFQVPVFFNDSEGLYRTTVCSSVGEKQGIVTIKLRMFTGNMFYKQWHLSLLVSLMVFRTHDLLKICKIKVRKKFLPPGILMQNS